MASTRPSLLLLLAMTTLGQTNDLSARLREVCAQSGDAELAVQQFRNRDFLSLEQMLEKRAEIDQPARVKLLSLEGAVAFVAGDMSGAVTHFGKAAGFGALEDRDAFTNAMALVALGDHRRAANLIGSLAQKHPKQSLYVYWQGRLDYDLRLYPEAIEKLQTATELDPASVRAWDALGLALDMEGISERASQAFQKAVALNRALPHPSAWPPHNLGSWYLRMNQFGQAEQALSESLRYDPNFAQAHYRLARTLEKQGRQEEAIVEYGIAIRTDTSSEDACYSLATLYRKLDRREAANAMFAEYRKRKERNRNTGLQGHLGQ